MQDVSVDVRYLLLDSAADPPHSQQMLREGSECAGSVLLHYAGEGVQGEDLQTHHLPEDASATGI